MEIAVRSVLNGNPEKGVACHGVRRLRGWRGVTRRGCVFVPLL